MGEPIISPWLFYFIDTIHNFDIILNVLFATLSVLIFIIEILSIIDDEFKECININIKQLIIADLVIVFFLILIPSKSTMYKMFVVNYITRENITEVKTESIKLIEDISEAIIDKLEKRGKK